MEKTRRDITPTCKQFVFNRERKRERDIILTIVLLHFLSYLHNKNPPHSEIRGRDSCCAPNLSMISTAHPC